MNLLWWKILYVYANSSILLSTLINVVRNKNAIDCDFVGQQMWKNVNTRNWNIVVGAQTVENCDGSLSAERVSVDDIGAHLILNTTVALLPSNASCHTVKNQDNHLVFTNSSSHQNIKFRLLSAQIHNYFVAISSGSYDTTAQLRMALLRIILRLKTFSKSYFEYLTLNDTTHNIRMNVTLLRITKK